MIETNHRDVVQELPNPEPSLAATAEADREIQARARELSGRLTWMPALKESDHFAKRFAAVSRVLDTVLASAEALPAERLASSEGLQWLHDNARLPRATQTTFQRDPSTLRRAPHVRDGEGASLPRVLAIAKDYLNAAKCEYSDHGLSVYVDAFQETVPLNMHELWLLPPALQLVLLEEIAARGEKLISQVAEKQEIGVLITSLREVTEAPWKELLEPLIAFDHVLAADPAKAYALMDYASRELYRNTVAELAQRSDRSELEIAQLVLQLALDSQKQKHTDPRVALRRAHVGYYLIGEGADDLRGRADVSLPWKQGVQNFLRRHPDEFYLGGIEVLTLLIVIAIMTPVYGLFSSFWTRILGILLLLLPASQSAVEVMNYLTTSLLGPRLLPKLDFSKGVPDDCLTMVVIPTLLLNEKQVRKLVDDLEVRYLGNAGPNLHYALLSDMPDSEEQPNEADPLVDLAASLIEKLNLKYAREASGSFTLLHRHRVYNPREGVWMGWERKRGKLLDFNRLIRSEYDSFAVKAGDVAVLPRIRYVITLDSDTELPRGTAHRLVGAMAHPLNRAVIDPRGNIVVAGYGILQPRVGISVQSASLSRLARMYSGQTGFDIYTRAVSDVYQDLYGEGIFTGKGIYEVDALQRVLEHRFPRNALLSHDLIEGAYARAGLVSDIEVIDDYPSHYSAYNRRKHRWLRGDWQIASWLLGKVTDEAGHRVRNPISFLSRWKILDNLRRSLVEAGAFLLFVLGWTVLPGRPLYWTLVTIAILFVPPWFQLAFSVARSVLSLSEAPMRDGFTGFLSAMVGVFLTLTFLAHQALLSADAVLRTWYRRAVSRERLLEWETAAEAESADKKSAVDILLNWTPAVSVVVGLVVYFARPQALYVALPILVLWACAKPLALWLNRSPRADRRPTSRSDSRFLRKAALHTWWYFAEFSNPEHNWLVPDYVRETPPFVAARISPTNLGFLFNARQAACELGYLTVPAFVDQTKRTMATALQLPRQRGHFFNWYDTRTLEPDRPRFISTVDSGNLVASLITLQQGSLALLNRPLLAPALFDGYADHLCALSEMKLLSKRVVAKFEDGNDRWLDHLWQGVELPAIPEGIARAEDARWFQAQTRDVVQQVRDTVAGFMPWLLPEFAALHANSALGNLAWREDLTLEKLPPFIDLLHGRLLLAHGGRNAVEEAFLRDRLRSLLFAAKARAQHLIADLRKIADDAGRLVREMDFRYLYDRRRKLLSIGSDAETGKVHAACYDLLASEARIAAFLAVANDHIPQESWFQLGRSQTVDSGHTTLVSWTGTMFEYLLPAVWLRWYPDTLLQRSMEAAVAIQRAYSAEHRVPWGVSECAFAVQDESGVYGYRAFGVPGLAVQQEAERTVVAPYATMLALDFDPEAAVKNLRWMNRKAFLGRYGFYEAVDFSADVRRARREPFVIVRQWMAHHQGMSLLAMTNFLRQGVVRNWFHSDARVQATELLLQERPIRHRRGAQAKRRTRKEAAPRADRPKSAIAA
jgi:cyclic beta-1,2-glucan synthetase